MREAALEVRGPTLFGELIIAIVYLPVLALEGLEGKLFRPMALTVLFALAGSMVLSLTYVPVLTSLVLRAAARAARTAARRLAPRLYRPVLEMRAAPPRVGGRAAALLVATARHWRRGSAPSSFRGSPRARS